MKREQEGLLILLKEIDNICRQNNITYYVSGGTVIGAARHEGFIPWDDDIDIYMTRDNWNMFRAVVKEQGVPDGRKVECWEDNKEFNNLLARYMDTDTTQIQKYQLYGSAATGQLIDIFVLDPMINDKEEIEKYKVDVMLTSDLINDYIVYSKRQTVCDEYKILRKRAKTEGKVKVVSELLERLEKYQESEAECYMLRWGGIPHCFPKNMFEEPKYLKFEDMMVPVPSNINQYLIQLYGIDWMYIPPHDEKFVHNFIVDYDNSYERYKGVIRKNIDNQVGKDLIKRKCRIFKDMQFDHDIDREMRLKEGGMIKAKVINQLREKNIDVAEILESKNYETVRPILKDYIAVQSKPTFIGNGTVQGYYVKNNPVFIDVGDDVLALALEIMVRDGRLSKARNVLQVRRTCVDRPVEGYLKTCETVFEGVAKAAELIEFEKYEEAAGLIDSLLLTGTNVELFKFKLIIMKALKGENPGEEYYSLLDSCLEKWPDDGDFYKFKGDDEFARGNIEKAIECYSSTLKMSRNGYFALQIGKQISGVKEQLISFIKSKGDKSRSLALLWLEIYNSDTALLGLYVDIMKGKGKSILNDRVVRDFLKNNRSITDRSCEAIAGSLGWTCGQAAFLMKHTGMISGEYGLQEPAEDNSDVSLLIKAVTDLNKGRIKEAYEKLLDLRESEDLFVSDYVAKKIRNDKLFMGNAAIKREIKDGFYSIRYGETSASDLSKAGNKSEKAAGIRPAKDRTLKENGINVSKIELLKELVELCEKKGIDYFVGGRIIYSYGTNIRIKDESVNDIELVVDGKNAKKLIAAGKEFKDNRVLESPLTNPTLRSVDMHYINTDSTEIDFKRLCRRKSGGIGIIIRIAKPKDSGIKYRIMTKLEAVWRNNSCYNFGIPLENKTDRLFSILFNIVNSNGNRITKKLFRKKLETSVGRNSQNIFIYSNKMIKKYSANIWNDRKKTDLFGISAWVPGHIEEYLSKLYGRDYIENPISPSVSLVDAGYSNHETENALYSDDLFWNSLLVKRKHLLKHKSLTVGHRTNWEIANRIVDVIQTEDKYLKDMELLKRCFETGQYFELCDYLEDYGKALELMKKYGIEPSRELKQLYDNVSRYLLAV